MELELPTSVSYSISCAIHDRISWKHGSVRMPWAMQAVDVVVLLDFPITPTTPRLTQHWPTLAMLYYLWHSCSVSLRTTEVNALVVFDWWCLWRISNVRLPQHSSDNDIYHKCFDIPNLGRYIWVRRSVVWSSPTQNTNKAHKSRSESTERWHD